ncbi:MAG: hypothetical protein ACE149_08275 [Armatimonadota bacterium]
MTLALRDAAIRVDPGRRGLPIDGFGVNINSKCWDGGRLAPVLDLLIDDLGATLFRVDAYGRSDWIDPTGVLGPGALSEENLGKVYRGTDSQHLKAMCRHLNARGIEPYLTLSGIVPKWMCADDGVTLSDSNAFAEMAASYVQWARKEAGIRFTLFGPSNETDIGPPEGPLVSPEAFVALAELLIEKLDARGLEDIRLVVAEQAHHDLSYVSRFLEHPKLMERIAVFGMHKYGDSGAADVVEAVRASGYPDCKVWMTEYGDLDQTGAREWPVAWAIFRRLMGILEDGLTGALIWDAFDNHHDHDERWTIYGLLRSGQRVYTPKKRYFACKHIYRFVRPGFLRVGASSTCESIRALAFASPDGADLTVVGMNEATDDVRITIRGANIDNRLSSKVDFHRTTASDDCVRVCTIHALGRNLGESGIEITAPARSIFTVTSVRV